MAAFSCSVAMRFGSILSFAWSSSSKFQIICQFHFPFNVCSLNHPNQHIMYYNLANLHNLLRIQDPGFFSHKLQALLRNTKATLDILPYRLFGSSVLRFWQWLRFWQCWLVVNGHCQLVPIWIYSINKKNTSSFFQLPSLGYWMALLDKI